MGGKVSYRHNVMRIDSIETFLNVKGGFHHDLRDVYFIRGLGEPERYVEKMAEIDKRMDREMKSGRLTYVRAKPLPRLSDVEETAFYTKAFDGWRAGGKLTLKKCSLGTVLQKCWRMPIGRRSKSTKRSKTGYRSP